MTVSRLGAQASRLRRDEAGSRPLLDMADVRQSPLSRHHRLADHGQTQRSPYRRGASLQGSLAPGTLAPLPYEELPLAVTRPQGRCPAPSPTQAPRPRTHG